MSKNLSKLLYRLFCAAPAQIKGLKTKKWKCIFLFLFFHFFVLKNTAFLFCQCLKAQRIILCACEKKTSDNSPWNLKISSQIGLLCQ